MLKTQCILFFKGFCLGLEEILGEYREKIIGIEREFLNSRVFTIASLKIALTSHFDILPDLHRTVNPIILTQYKYFIKNKGFKNSWWKH